ncbi:MAG: hypothetical protein IPK26_22765 [Planctomycetes bacterium]|nr:hypothetical protein [Planctomycetota bacterium]
MKWIPVLSLTCLLGLGGTAWALLAQDDSGLTVPSGAGTAVATPTDPPQAELAAARRDGSLAAFDALVARRRQATAESAANGQAWCLLAEALLERVLQRNQLRGMAVGEPLHTTLPPALAQDLDDGLAAIAAARRAGVDSAESYRIEAGLLSNKITGLGAALQFNGQVQKALNTAFAKAPESAPLHVALGLRKLLAPRLLGHDPEKALEHLEFAAKNMPDDERPGVFAAMAAFLTRRRQKAIEWLEQAVARNPGNVFARVVLQRIRRDEADPFGRDVTPAEAAAK